MLDLWSQWSTIQKIILNSVFVSIPEEFFLTMFTLIAMGEFDYWQEEECKKLINPWDYSRVFVPTVVTALLVNIFRYYKVNIIIGNIIPIIVFFILLSITNEILHEAKALKWILKAILCFLLGFIILGISEMLYLPFVIYSTELSMQKINNSILMNFLLSLPSRFIQYFILIFLIIRKRTLLKGNIVKYIISNPLITFITFTIVIFNLSFLAIMYNAIIYRNLLTHLSFLIRSIIIVTVQLLPIINIASLIWGIYHTANHAATKQKDASDTLYNLADNIKVYINNSEYNDIAWKLNEISGIIENVSQDLYERN